MGFLKKLLKPVSKVLDKIVPNEIKPLLPYAAAFAPYMLPAGMTFGATSGIMSNPMFARALASGGINALSQLSQEGNDGELNKMSLGLAALQGGMGADGAAKGFRGMKDTTRATELFMKAATLGHVGALLVLKQMDKLLGNTTPSFTHTRTSCSFCGVANAPPAVKVNPCSGCHSVYYCSKEHQRMDWKLSKYGGYGHREECKKLQDASK